jgi:outer membrane lipoprotein-sorting protein
MRRCVALAVLVVVLSGCSGLGGDGSNVPDGETAAQGYDSLESVEGTIEFRTVGRETNTNSTVRTLRRPADGTFRQEFLSPPEQAGDVTVSNGSVTWIYNATGNEVTRLTVENESAIGTDQGTFVKRVFGNLSTTEEGSAIVAPLRPIPGSSGETRGESAMIGPFGSSTQPVNLTYLGTETIAERRTHGIRLTPINSSDDGTAPANASAPRYVENTTYWFDAEYFYPLRTATTLRIDGAITRSVRVYRNVTFDVDIEPGTFRFDVPANATVRSGPTTVSFDSVAAAAENVSFAVADPDPPGEFDLETVDLTRFGNRTTVSVRYSDGTDFLTVSSQRPPFEGREGDPVSLGPVTGTRSTAGNVVAITWQCGGTRYAVSGRLPADAIEAVARDAAAVCSNDGVSGVTGRPRGLRLPPEP